MIFSGASVCCRSIEFVNAVVKHRHFWLVVKVAISAATFCSAAFTAFEFTPDEVPPLWMGLACFPICFGQGIFLRIVGENRRWTENELWFAPLLTRPLNQNYYYAPFYHFGAIGFIVSAIGYFIAAALQKNQSAVGLGFLLANMGLGVLLGMRMKDLFKAKLRGCQSS